MLVQKKFYKHLVDEVLNRSLNQKPLFIQKLIIEKHKVIVPCKSISNYIQRLKKKKGIKTFNILDLIDFCGRCTYELNNLDKPFVTNYTITNQKINIAITTLRLLGLLKYSSNFHADGTYKLNINKFPILIIGCTDKLQRFLPIFFMISSSEQTSDYVFLFTELVNKYRIFFNDEHHIQNFVADGAQAITSAYSEVFGREKRRCMCWFHMKTSVEKKTKHKK